MNKKRYMRYFIFGLFVSFFLAGQSLAGVSPITNFTLNFDENGHATVIPSTGSSFSESGVLGTSPDGFTKALSYALPALVFTGPVRINDPDGSISDFLLFDPEVPGTGMTQTMWFYSDPGADLADLSATDWATAVSLYSNAPVGATEAADGTFTYGSISLGALYNGISSASAVPEPSTILLLGAGLAGVGIMRKKFKK